MARKAFGASVGAGHDCHVVALLQQVVNEGGVDVAGSAENGDFPGHGRKKVSRGIIALGTATDVGLDDLNQVATRLHVEF